MRVCGAKDPEDLNVFTFFGRFCLSSYAKLLSLNDLCGDPTCFGQTADNQLTV